MTSKFFKGASIFFIGQYGGLGIMKIMMSLIQFFDFFFEKILAIISYHKKLRKGFHKRQVTMEKTTYRIFANSFRP